MERVLIIKMWALGDILMATPLLAALRASCPQVKVSWVVDVRHAELLAQHPEIDELIPLDSGAWRRLRRRGNLLGWASQTRNLRKQMQSRRFDAVINCHPEKWWSWFLCAAPIRIGLYPLTSMPFRQLYTQAIPRERIHNTNHYLRATQALGCPDADKKLTIGQTSGETEWVGAFRQAHGIAANAAIIVIAPFSTGENRIWESARLAEIADWLYITYSAQIVIPCSHGDVERAREIAGLARQAHIHLAENTDLRQYIGLLRHADLVICGDSSPMHIAAAVGTSYLALFGPTPIAERAPLVGRGLSLAKTLPCAPCDLPTCANTIFRECMKLITVADVQAAVTRLLPQRVPLA